MGRSHAARAGVGRSCRARLAGVSLAVGLAVAGLGACKGKGSGADGPSVEEAGKPFEGIYALEARTRNDAACGAEGKSLITKDSDRFLVANITKGLIGKVLVVSSCKSVEHCREVLKKASGVDFLYTLSGVKGKDLTGVEFFTGFSGKGKTCRDGKVSEVLLKKTGDSLVLEARGVKVSYPADERGYCDTRAAKRHAKGKPCNEYTVIRGKRVAGLQ